MKKRMTIEKLLQWAIREELPKGKSAAASLWDAITRYAETGGVRVDTGSPSGIGLVPGTPHPDAEIVAGAIRALNSRAAFDAEGCAALLCDYAFADAEAIAAVAGTPFNPQALIVRCAALGGGMEWDIGQPQPCRVTYPSNSKPIIFGLTADGGLEELRLGRNDRWYPLEREPRAHLHWSDPSFGQLLEARAEYAVWHGALLQLVELLAAADLREHAALPPASPAAPWLTGAPPEAAVLIGAGTALPGRPLPLQPQRGIKAGPPLESAIEAAMKRGRRRRRPARRSETPTYGLGGL